MFHSMFTTSHAGAGTEPYNRQATADPHPSGWCATTGTKCTLRLWRRRANVLGMARRVSCHDRVFAHDGFGRLTAATSQSQAPTTGLHLHLGVQ
jgi:hypothetical protein